MPITPGAVATLGARQDMVRYYAAGVLIRTDSTPRSVTLPQ